MGMAYSSTNPARKILDGGAAGGLVSIPSSGAGISGGASIFSYCSTHGATDIVATGFFTGCGAQPFSSTGQVHPNVLSRSPNIIGMRPGDLVVNIESSGGATPGRVTWHGVSASTFAGSTSGSSSHTHGYDCTVSAHAST